MLSKRARDALNRVRITDKRSLLLEMKIDKAFLQKLPNVGPTTIRELQVWLGAENIYKARVARHKKIHWAITQLRAAACVLDGFTSGDSELRRFLYDLDRAASRLSEYRGAWKEDVLDARFRAAFAELAERALKRAST